MLVDTCCGKLFVDVVGEGPDLVLWPGMLTDSAGLWYHQLAPLSERYRVFAVDPPGHGRSPPSTRAYRMDDSVLALSQVLDATGAHRPAFLGLSWGAMIGMRLAARRPELLSALVLANASARTNSRWERVRYGALGLAVRVVGPVRPLVDRVVPVMFAHPAAHPEEVGWYAAQLARMTRTSIGHAVDAVLLFRSDATAEVARIRVPTLVIAGADDTALPLPHAQALARAIPGAELVVLPGAGHLSCLEAPERFTAEVLRFLDAHRARAPERLGQLALPGLAATS